MTICVEHIQIITCNNEINHILFFGGLSAKEEIGAVNECSISAGLYPYCPRR